MDKAMKIIAILVPAMIIVGMILEYFEVEKAHLLTGTGVLGVMFVLIPFFLFWRYDKKRQIKELEANREE
ncbi:MAG: hypothetical protein KAG37_02385 [Flavobacteriales bacterium]|nr:hypothetical protein [Flavobacteriales bacterium]